MKENWRKVLLGLALVVIFFKERSVLYEKSPRSVLENSDSFTLYSLWGGAITDEPSHLLGRFHSIGILGQKQITDPKLKVQLVDALYGPRRSEPQYSCFNPGHSIRATRNGRTVDVVVCFDCGNMDFYENGKQRYYHLPFAKESSKVLELAVARYHLRSY